MKPTRQMTKTLSPVTVTAKRIIKLKPEQQASVNQEYFADTYGTYVNGIGNLKNINKSAYLDSLKVNPKFGSDYEADGYIRNTTGVSKFNSTRPQKYNNGTTSAIGGVSSFVGNAAELTRKEDDPNYLANIGGGVAKGAMTGASIGSVIPGWGTAVGAAAGAVIGGVSGYISSNNAENAIEAKNKQIEINTNANRFNGLDAAAKAQYDLNNYSNNTVSGFKHGTPYFNNKNAMVSKGEGIVDGQTGRLDVIPGRYDASNPDTVNAALSQGTSVMSANPAQTIPGGNSTPADVIKRAEKIQANNDKILFPKQGQRKLSGLDGYTAWLNKSNIDKQVENLNKFNSLVNPHIANTANNIPRYKDGYNPIFTSDPINDVDITDSPVINDNNGTIRSKMTFADVESLKAMGDPSYTPQISPSKALSQENDTNVPPVGESGLDGFKMSDFNTFTNKLGSVANKIGSLAPIAYNALNSTPEVVSPIYDNFINPTQRYDISSKLADSVKQRQIARYNNSISNNGTGADMAMSADLYSRGVEQSRNIMDSAETANNAYKSDYANRYNQNASSNAAEQRRVYDLNARNRAASRSAQVKNAEMISQYSQTNELMGNQKKSDMLNANIWNAIATATNPKDKQMLMDMLSQYTNS